MASASFVHDLGIVLGVAAGTGILCRRIKQPAILGFLGAGLIVGPYIPIPLFADMDRVHSLAEFGVVLVMFAIGLEFQLSKLFKVLPVAGFAALVQIGTLLLFGFTLGRVFSWSPIEALFLGAGICISSTMLVSKVFEEKEVSQEVRTIVLGILVLQDVAAIGLIASMTAVAESGVFSIGAMSLTLGKLMLTLVIMVAAGLLVVPRLVRFVMGLKSEEATVITAVGLCFLFSLLAELLGYSVALGAFVGGLLVAESGFGHQMEESIKPLKDVFAAIFFVSIGMTVDPMLAIENIGPALVVFAGVVLFQLLSITGAGVLSGNGLSQSLTAGLSLGQIGEFGFIIISIGMGAGVIRPHLQPILVTVAVLTAFTTPLALSKASKVVAFVDRHLPDRFQHLLTVYESWFEELRRSKPDKVKSPAGKAMRAIIIDVLAWILMAAVFLYHFDRLTAFLAQYLGSFGDFAILLTYALLVILSLPPLHGLMRNMHNLEQALVDSVNQNRTRANAVLTKAGVTMLRAAIRVSVLLGAGIPAVALLRPLDHSLELGVLIFAAIVWLVVYFWKSAGQLETDFRSEAERLMAFLDSQRADDVEHQTEETPRKAFFPNLGKMESIYIQANTPLVGKTLSEIDLRALTGALVVAIHRDGQDLVLPTGSKTIEKDDLLFVTGTTVAVAQARELFKSIQKP